MEMEDDKEIILFVIESLFPSTFMIYLLSSWPVILLSIGIAAGLPAVFIIGYYICGKRNSRAAAAVMIISGIFSAASVITALFVIVNVAWY